MRKILVFLFLHLLVFSCFSQNNASLLRHLVFDIHKDSFPEITAHPENYPLQMIYVQIDRDSSGFPHFTTYNYGLEHPSYFYPACLIKLPTVLLSLEKLQDLKEFQIDKYTKLNIGKAHSYQTALTADKSGPEGYPCIANFIRKILLVSDNTSYNRLFEFLGRDEIQDRLMAKGYTEVYIPGRFSRCSDEEDRFTNPFQFFDKSGNTLYYQKAKESKTNRQRTENIPIGKGYLDDEENYVDEAKDFKNKANLPLNDALDMFIAFFFPETLEDRTRKWNISQEDRYFLLQYMSKYPRQSFYPAYKNYKKYEDSYKKYFIVADTKDTIYDDDFKIFNIVGLSYGFSCEVAYIVNIRTGVEFFLAAALYTNDDGVLNNDHYDYHKVAFPFYGKLGRIIYAMETQRKKAHFPDFTEIKKALSLPDL
jgi:hypothetical protein